MVKNIVCPNALKGSKGWSDHPQNNVCVSVAMILLRLEDVIELPTKLLQTKLEAQPSHIGPA